MNKTTFIQRAAITAALIAASVITVLGQTQQNLKILFIGNSYTIQNNLPLVLTKLAAAAPEPIRIETGRVLVGGSTLQQHWGRPAGLEAIRKGGWDFVVLQEQSMLGGRIVDGVPELAGPAAFLEFARLYNAEIRKTNARTVFYLTWSREAFPETQAKLTEAYRSAARELSATLSPVGLAFMNARIGNPELKLYNADQHHPSPTGTYLIACVFYAALMQRNPAGLPAVIIDDSKPESPKELIRLSDEDAAYLQKVAWRTVQFDPYLAGWAN
jgi:hypothetical protein